MSTPQEQASAATPAATVLQPAPAKSPIPGVKEMLVGPVGVGKTAAIATLVEAGLKVYAIFTEPSFEVLGDQRHGRVLQKIEFDYIPPANTDFSDMLYSAKLINTLTMKGLSNLDDINKTKHAEFMKLVSVLNEKQVERWGTGHCLVLDSMSGLNIMAMNLVVGSKPVKSMADWGIAMDNLERMVQKLCTGLRCHFMMTAHAEMERDEVTGQTFIMAGTLGRKLAPKIPRYFSDVIYVKREATNFSWSTVEMGADLKARNLPYSAGLKPTFVQIINAWKDRGGILEPV